MADELRFHYNSNGRIDRIFASGPIKCLKFPDDAEVERCAFDAKFAEKVLPVRVCASVRVPEIDGVLFEQMPSFIHVGIIDKLRAVMLSVVLGKLQVILFAYERLGIFNIRGRTGIVLEAH